MTQNQPAQVNCSCPVCGTIQLSIAKFYLAVHPLDPRRSFYQFTCPTCQECVTKEASQHVIEVLSAHGVTRGMIPGEADQPHDGPVLGTDDLLDLLLDLEQLATLQIPGSDATNRARIM